MSRFIHLALSLLSGAGSALVFWFLIYLPFRLWFGAVVLLWFAAVILLVRFLNQSASHKTRTALLAAVTMISGLGLISVVEQAAARWAVIIIYSFLTFALGVLSVPGSGLLDFKEIRRLIMTIWTWNMYAIFTAVYAVLLFFPEIPWWLVFGAGSAMFGLSALQIWRLYLEKVSFATHGFWFFLFALAGLELIYTISNLPFGYFVSGFLTAWIWYLAELMARFHFSPAGILWRKQRWFLFGNALALAAWLIFFVRWI